MRPVLILIFIWFLPYTAYAGMGACHDGNGNITALTEDYTNRSTFEAANCKVYSVGFDGVTQTDFDRIFAVIHGVPRKYIKWMNEPVEMTAQEKAAVDAIEAAQVDAELRTMAKAQFNGQQVTGLALRCQAKAIVDAINVLRKRDRDRNVDVQAATSLANLKTLWQARQQLDDITLTNAKNAIQACVDQGQADE